MLEGDFTCSTHWKWRFICDADQWWHSFCVAGAVFGEVRVGLFVAGAALRDILGDSRDAKCCILQYKIVSKMGRVRSRKRRVRDDVVGCGRIIVGCGRIIVGCGRIIVESSFYWRSIQGVTAEIWSFQISWQAHYLVRLQGDFTCSTHWKWRCICDTDQEWHSFCVAGAVFDDIGGWLYLLQFYMWRRSGMTFILRGRRSIWWYWRVTLLAPRIGNDVLYVTQISDDIHFAWQAQYLVKCESDFSWQAQHFVTFWEIAGTRNVVFYNTKSSPRWDE